ncbi:hypothetical protein [Priestia filamentosa]|uniref:hypothetical protein n=1 Tax=Priestia filamentosa TaxID=1402861 RepID=UPI000A08B818|nr:hypothetical protein [Priestia filamentosa]OXS72071.1 hypothetical protein B1B01_07065 [Priestia filamentosa]SMF18457.1 hypothetical protein SAMN06296056_1011446 [Priestia filamentosa]
MTTSELIIFKKDTDAPGSNRGFVYQYLKTLVLWLNNFKDKKENTIFCEVEDDIKEINLIEQNLKFTQLKCYSSAFNIDSGEIKKSIYNFFLLYLIYDDYEGEYVFETNTHISNQDLILEKWMNYQGALHTNEEVKTACVSKTQEILREIFEQEKSSLEKSLEKKIMNRKERLKGNPKKAEDLQSEIFTFDKELKILQSLSINFETKINNEEVVQDFANRILWVFENIKAVDSINVLKEQIYTILEEILEDKNAVELYFCRLLSEINFKAVKEKKEQRYLDNKLLKKIFEETDDVIRSGISVHLLQQFDGLGITITQGFTTVNENILQSEERLRKDIYSLSSTLTQNSSSDNDYKFYDLPMAEPEEIANFIKQEKGDYQSNLEGKFHKIEGIDEGIRKNLLQTATELRCRYLMYLQRLKYQNLHKEREEIRKLEKKVEDICNDAVMGFKIYSNISSADFYLSFKKQLELELEKFNERVKVKRFAVDSDIVYGQMFHMAAKCFLRWHRER